MLLRRHIALGTQLLEETTSTPLKPALIIESREPAAQEYVKCVLWKHCGVYVRRLAAIAAFCAVLATADGAALALEEQKAPVAPAAPGQSAVGVQDGAAAAPADSGTEIRIPGLGKLGTLPKMDFGLELLYGAADGKAPDEQPPAVDSEPEDLTIRGSVKHRF